MWGMKRWPGGDLDRKNNRNWVKIGPFWMKKRPVKAQSRGESIGPHFSGLKTSKKTKNDEKPTAKDQKRKLTLIERIMFCFRKVVEIVSELVRLGSKK